MIGIVVLWFFGNLESKKFNNNIHNLDNLGDAKSLATHPATTTHRRLGAEGRAAAGITDGVVRISVGLEAVEDLLEDIDQALAAC